MAEDPILSQDEVEALLDQDGDAGAGTDSVRSYDFASQDRIVRGRLPTLELITERFARQLRVSLAALLRRSVDVTPVGVNVKKFEEHIASVSLPASANVIQMSPLRGKAVVTMPPELVFAIIDFFFGGDGTITNGYEEHEFTPTELGIIKSVMERIIRHWQDAWGVVLPVAVEHVKTESNPRFASIANPTEPVLDCTFDVEVDGQSAKLHITIPYAMVEPIREVLVLGVKGDRNVIDERWSQTLRGELMEAKVPLKVCIATSQVSIRELIALKAGDVLPLIMEERVPVRSSGVQLFRGQFGVHNERYAVRLTDMTRRAALTAIDGGPEVVITAPQDQAAEPINQQVAQP